MFLYEGANTDNTPFLHRMLYQNIMAPKTNNRKLARTLKSMLLCCLLCVPVCTHSFHT